MRDENLTQSLVEKEHQWFTKLITFIWSHFEHNIDVNYLICLYLIIYSIFNKLRSFEIQVYKAIN